MGKPQLRKAVYAGTAVQSSSLTELLYLHEVAVAVDEAGIIVAREVVGARESPQAVLATMCDKVGWKVDEVDLRVCGENEFFFPGFIDTHIHASQYPNVGIFGKTTLLSWLTKYTFPMESSLSNLAKARDVYSACVTKTLSHGTTTASYFATISVPATNLLADLCLSYGQRAFIGRVCMNTLSPDYYRDESVEASVKATEDNIAYIKTIDPSYALVSPIITPRFALSCTAPLLQQLGDLAKSSGLPVQTHISENHLENEETAKMFPECPHYAGVYDKYGLLTNRTVLAHGVHLSTVERDLIKQRGSGVSHCPVSNSSITSGTAKVRWMLDAGVKVGLGTDVSGGYAPSILEAVRQTLLVSRHVAMRETPDNAGVPADDTRHRGKDAAKLSIEECLYLATVGGARVLGIEGKVGAFEVGMEWDAQLISLGRSVHYDAVGPATGSGPDLAGRGPVDIFGWETWDEKIAKWVFNGDDRNTQAVWVQGRLVHERK